MSNQSTSGSVGTNTGSNVAGSAAFLSNDRERQRTPEMELFSHGRKPRSNFRRPSSLGLAKTPLPNKSESSGSFQPKPAGRSHIVAPIKDHLKPEGGFEKTSEVKANYRNLSPARPVINKIKDHLKNEEGPLADISEIKSAYVDFSPVRPYIYRLSDHLKNEDVPLDDVSEKKSAYVDFNPARPTIYKLSDHLKPEGDFAKNSEMHSQYKDAHPSRPVIHRIRDHSAEVQPEGRIQASTESGNYKKMSKGGEIVSPGWVSSFEKVTIS